MKHKLFQSPRLLVGIVLLIFLTGCEKELDIKDNDLQPAANADLATKANRESSKVATDWYNLQAEIMLKSSPQPSPVATGRFFAYEGIVLYEAVRHGIPNSVSLSSLLYQMPPMPAKEENNGYSWPIVANAAMAQITRQLYPNLTQINRDAINTLEASYNAKLSPNMNSEVFRRSQQFGVAIADAVYEWSRSDGNSRNSESYTPPSFPGAWVPTPTGFALAAVPYMGSYRPFLEEHLTGVVPPFPYPYSEEVGSDFYKQVDSTYQASTNATDEQKIIATFWHDTGVGTGYTTPGHHLKILTAILENNNTDLGKAAIAYAKTGIAIRDAFIMTWRSKYTYNLLRPVTYVRAVIPGGANWLPYIAATPNHPEYPAAHAVVTSAFMKTMAGLFGNNFSFTDNTYGFLGVTPRQYNSFSDAATEAGLSRIYGGIHYPVSVRVGLVAGKEIGKNVNALDLQH